MNKCINLYVLEAIEQYYKVNELLTLLVIMQVFVSPGCITPLQSSLK